MTDANLVLGRLDPDYFLGGSIRLDRAAAERAVTALGERLGLGATDAAHAIIGMANENMANAIRVLSIDRGLDPREFALVAFGGAGPLHAAALAETMGMRRVVVPLHPGLCSAFGALIADLQVNKVHSTHARSDAADAAVVQGHFERLIEEATVELRQEGFTGTPEFERSISMRYAGQNYEKDVPVEAASITAEALQQIFRAFERLHEQFYGYAISGETIELIRYNVTAVGRTPKPSLRPLRRNGAARPVSSRDVAFEGRGWLTTPIYRRDELLAGASVDGPAVIEEVDSTTLVHPGQRLDVDEFGVMTLALGE